MRGRNLVTTIIVVGGVLITAVAGLFSYRAYRHAQIQQTSFKADNAASAARLALDRVALAVRAVRAIYAADWVTPDQFVRFAQTLTSNEGIRSLAFARRVEQGARQTYERAFETGVKSEPAKTLGIWQYGKDGKPVRAPPGPVYFPLEAAYLLDGTEPAYGLDLASLPGRAAMINQAISKFDVVVSKPLEFDDPARQGVILFVPAVDRTGSIVGVAIGTLTFSELAMISALASGASGVTIGVDASEPKAAAQPVKAQAAAGPGPPNRRVFNFGGRTWTITVAERADGNTAGAWLVVLIVGAGLATTAAVAAYAIGLGKTAEIAEARRRLRDMLDGLGPLAWLLTPDGKVIHANRAASTALGRPEIEPVGQPFWNLPLRAKDRTSELERIRAAIKSAAGGHDVRFDLVLAGDSDGERVFDLWIRPLGGGTASPTDLVASAVDITDRHEGEQTQRMLMRELDHRMKNTLQVIQAVIRRTARAQRSVSMFEHSLLGRVGAMSRAHDLLAQQHWVGADMGTVVTQEVSSFDAGGAIRTEGPELRLNPRAALSMALAVHELGTNASKYGALSSPEGTVTMTWEIDRSHAEPAVVLSWRESGGPKVVTPNDRGFGSMLIERSIAYELDGQASLDYRPEGVVCTISIPLRMLRPFVEERVNEAAGQA